MKVIFLDIDGVLNYRGSDFIDARCLNNLRHIVNETGAKIVIISTWRVCMDETYYKKYVSKPNKELDRYREILTTTFSGNIRWFDITSDLNERRSDEIKLWLNNHPEFTNFVVIDDFNVQYDENFPDNWVRPSYYSNGLNTELANRAIEILNRDLRVNT